MKNLLACICLLLLPSPSFPLRLPSPVLKPSTHPQRLAKTSLPPTSVRRSFLLSPLLPLLPLLLSPSPSLSAPPTAVMAQELGYFPVTTQKGQTKMVPAEIKSVSTEQAVRLAEFLKKKGAVFYSAYW